MPITFTRRSFAYSSVAAAILITACGGGKEGSSPDSRAQAGATASDQGGMLDIQVLSSRPELVSGGDALLHVKVPSGIDLSRVTILRNGTDVTSQLVEDPGGGGLIGLVSGLTEGANTVVARFDGREHDKLELTNYPRSGPMISGPHESPFACTTQNFVPFTGTPALGAPLDANCSVERRVQYVYRTTAGTFQSLAWPCPDLPADLAYTTTITGAKVPYIVRLETGTINRAIYQTAILHNPDDPEQPTAAAPPKGWNKRLIYPLGGGCIGGWYTQGPDIVNPLNDSYLSKGYGVAVATLNTFGNNCNDLLSSETILMVKERFIETFGEPMFTIGTGGSGGAYQSNQTGDNYPGTFDGIVTTSSFPDVTTGMIPMASSRLMDIYFNQTRPGVYTTEQQKAITGYLSIPGMIHEMSQVRAPRMDPTAEFPEEITAGVGPQFRYDPDTNPFGARATVYDHTVNVYGKIQDTPVVGHASFAQRPLDNVGVQYGLAALNDGVITVDQFLDLNARVGGLDIDFKHMTNRMTAHRDATRRAYEGGRILFGGNGLRDMPIITRMGGGDLDPEGDVHVRYHAHSIRARLIEANGHADNQVIVGNEAPIELLIDQMDRWLSAIESDPSDRPLADRVVANKPGDVVDACWSDDVKIVEKQTLAGTGRCNSLFPVGLSPELVAGAPIELDIIKCTLKPIDSDDYDVPFTDSQRTQLESIFPNGVCDWSKSGHQQVKAVPWASYGPSPVNQVFDVRKP